VLPFKSGVATAFVASASRGISVAFLSPCGQPLTSVQLLQP
jgi:hypothetical protein